MDITIREMTLKDIDKVVEIENLSFIIPWPKQSFLGEMLNKERSIYLVSVYKNQVLGYCGMWKVLDEGHITNIATHPEYRRMNLGRKLLDGLIKVSESKGIKTMFLEVRKSNIPAQNLYKDFKFKIVGERKKYYANNNEDAYIMKRVSQ